MLKQCLSSLLLGCLLWSSQPAHSQMSPNWDIHSLEKAEANNSHAISSLNAGNVPQAIALLRRSCEQDPGDPKPLLTLSNLLTMEGSYTEALANLQKSYSLRPSCDALITAGIVYYLQHDYAAAINSWNKVIEANPRNCQVYASIGMARLRQGQLDQAAECFKLAVKHSPNSSLGYYGLALTHYLAGNLSASREEAERAEAISQYPPVMLLLSQLDFLEGDVVRGNQHARQSLALQHKHLPNQSMVELGFDLSEDFHWDPFLADNYDNGFLVLAREAPAGGSQRSYNNKGHLDEALQKAQIAITSTAVTPSETMQKSFSLDHRARFVLSTGISHELNGDLYITHELGLLKLSQGDYASAAAHFQSVLAQCDACNVDRLYLARALALDGKNDQAIAEIAEFRHCKPMQHSSVTIGTAQAFTH